MKKLLLLGITAAIVCALLAGSAVMAAPGAKDNPSKDKSQNLYLYQKNDDANWSIVWGGAWGKYNYKIAGTGNQTTVSGPFNGHRLVPGTNYSLIYYPEPVDNPWTAPPVVFVIGSGTVDEFGDIHIMGSCVLGVPDEQPAVGDYVGQFGDKIWLVLSSDLSTDASGVTTMVGWNPDDYLFEYKLINTP
jgi:hypothetical protein